MKQLQSNLEWRLVKNSVYYVSEIGQIGRKLDDNVYHVMSIHDMPSGYKKVNLTINCERKNCLVHVLVAEAFLGERPKGKVVNHKNGIKYDNRVENLEWITRSENNQHAYLTGLQRKMPGSKCAMAKLNEDAIMMIRECKSLSNNRIAKIFSVDLNTIRDIKKGRTWQHIPMISEPYVNPYVKKQESPVL